MPLVILICGFGATFGTKSAISTKGADASAVDGSGTTPLHQAANKRSIECVRLLLDAGAGELELYLFRFVKFSLDLLELLDLLSFVNLQ